MPEIGLNITSLMDILTVIVIFLVKTLTLASESSSVAEDIRLPYVATDVAAEEATVISLSQKEVRVNQDVVIRLGKNTTVPPNELAPDHRTLLRVKDRLDKERAKKLALLKAKGVGTVAPGKIIIQADKDLAFDTVKYVLNTVSVVGYTDLQFLTIAKESP
jgi:biopolymer transport protein ExbD